MNNNDFQFKLKPLHLAVATALVGVTSGPIMATETSTFTAERIIVASCNPCAAAKCNPCAAKCNPCAAAKCNPCAAKCNPCAAKKKKCNPCGACNPCAAKCNPCAAKKCNPCAASACNPCNPCNPCGAAAAVNPCAVKRNPCHPTYKCTPCGLAELGKALWADPKFSTNGLACATCHVGGQAAFLPTFAQAYPHPVAMATAIGIKEMTAEEMVQFCLVQPMASKTLAWDSKELAALTAYTLEVQKGFNPCAATGGGCNPCAAKCNPCAAKCNPCAAKKCNPCAAKCNPCGAKCNPCAAKKTTG